MPSSEIVSDTGPLISLEKIPQGFALLKKLFARVYLPPEVLGELQSGHPDKDYLRLHALDSLVQIESSPSWDAPGANRLDPGERAAIALAISRKSPLMIEERLGRKLADEAGVAIIGAAGLIRVAYRKATIGRDEAVEMWHQLYDAERIGKQLFESLLADLAAGIRHG